MINEEPQVSKTGRYSIAATCAALAIHRSTLQRYTEAGLISSIRRRGTRGRLYLGSEILRFWKAQ